MSARVLAVAALILALAAAPAAATHNHCHDSADDVWLAPANAGADTDKDGSGKAVCANRTSAIVDDIPGYGVYTITFRVCEGTATASCTTLATIRYSPCCSGLICIGANYCPDVEIA